MTSLHHSRLTSTKSWEQKLVRVAYPTKQEGKGTDLFVCFGRSGQKINLSPLFHSGIDRAAFDKWKVQYWQQRSADFRSWE